MKLQPGQRIQWQDYRDGSWNDATVVRVDIYLGDTPPRPGKLRVDFQEVDYPFDESRARGTDERFRLALYVDFYADDPYYVWPWRRRAPDKIREPQEEGP